MDTLATLQDKYVASQVDDAQRGCVRESERTFILGQFLIEAKFRTEINDQVTLARDLSFTYANYSI